MIKTRAQTKWIKSPLNYIGGKYKLLDQIVPLFPNQINKFVDLFAGGCNVGINIKANEVIFNDNLTYLIDLYKVFQNQSLDFILHHIEKRIVEFNLSTTNQDGFLALRNTYNQNKHPLDLLVLIAYSFNHQIRFNNNHKYNNPFGKNRSNFNESIKHNLIHFILKLKSSKYEFQNNNFDKFNFINLNNDDFVYCDPPYLITNGTYNDGKRGFTGWTSEEEIKLLSILEELNSKNVKFALSNVIEHNEKENIILKNWVNNSNFKINYLNYSYSNSNYQQKNKKSNSSIEVLITNYEVENEKLRMF